MVSQPNDWSRTVKESAAAAQSEMLMGTRQLHLRFWTQFRQFMESRGGLVWRSKPHADSWTNVALGRTHFQLSASNSMRDGVSAVDLVIGGPDAKAHFHLLGARHRQDVEARLGPLEWREAPGAKTCQVRALCNGTPSDPTTWPDVNEWLAGRLETMHAVFAPLVKTLDAAEYKPEGPVADDQPALSEAADVEGILPTG